VRVWIMTSHVLAVLGAAVMCALSLARDDVAFVTTPAELQQAVRARVKHIIVIEHMDLTETPHFEEAQSFSDGIIAVNPAPGVATLPEVKGLHTETIRVRRPHASATLERIYRAPCMRRRVPTPTC
jgi:hypothetical protein